VAGYHPRRGGRYDSREDRSPTLEPPGTHVFSREIHTASFPQRFRQPTSIDKYTGETNPACGSMTTAWLPAGRSHHRRGHQSQPVVAPFRLGADVA
jgi:hypothetical protein